VLGNRSLKVGNSFVVFGSLLLFVGCSTTDVSTLQALKERKKQLLIEKHDLQRKPKRIEVPRKFLRMPVRGVMSSPYGLRDLGNGSRMHKGVDFAVREGEEVISIQKGVVEFVGFESGFGNYVIVRHDGFKTLYAHLSSFKVEKGDILLDYEPVGLSGNTGKTTGPHLHFEVIVDGVQVDPIKFIDEYNGKLLDEYMELMYYIVN
jgi:murein DD-endopeptidase MepM/ murein hydrolase activator NlpD